MALTSKIDIIILQSAEQCYKIIYGAVPHFDEMIFQKLFYIMKLTRFSAILAGVFSVSLRFLFCL